MLAIITGTICPPTEMEQLVLRDTTERLKQYIESLRFTIESKAFKKIVFCENSNYGTADLETLNNLAVSNDVELELLSFKGNIEQILLHGKGYGEGEIVEYALQNSSLAKGEYYFVKITGRLRIENIRQIVGKMQYTRTYFNIPNFTRNDIYDTRLYAMAISQFQKLFIKEYRKVQDDDDIFLEHVYTSVLVNNKIKVHNFPRYPRIVGVSGTGGITYAYTEWKCVIKDIISKFNLYSVRNKSGHIAERMNEK